MQRSLLFGVLATLVVCSAPSCGGGDSDGSSGGAGGGGTSGEGGSNEGGSAAGEGGSSAAGGMSASGGAGGGMTTAGGKGGSATGGAPGTGGMVVVDKFSPCPATGDCKIMFFGDGLTVGEGDASKSSFRKKVFDTVTAQAKKAVSVGAFTGGTGFSNKHDGTAGKKIDDLTAMVPKVVTDNAPHIVFVMAGAEDLWADKKAGGLGTCGADSEKASLLSAKGLGIAKAASMKLAALLDKIITAAPNAQVIVSSSFPVDPTFADIRSRPECGYNALMLEYENQMATFAADKATAGKHVSFVRLTRLLAASQDGSVGGSVIGDYSFNQYYPKQSGYDKAGTLIYNVGFKSLLK